MAQSGRSWLSRHAQELVVRSAQFSKDPFDCDLLIVGSGYGGAVAAARAAGHQVANADGSLRDARVWVIERGNEYLPGMFPSRFSEIAGHVRFDMQDGRRARGVASGLFDARLGPDVCVLLGSGLGGGSLINAGVMVCPGDDVFASGWPREITREALADGYAKALCMLSPQPVPEDKECAKLRSFGRVAAPDRVDRAPVTVHWQDERNPVGVQMKACTLCGDCLTGCNQSAKGSLDTNYLAFARSRSRDVEMFCGGTVDTIARDATDSYWEVRWQYTEPAMRPADGQSFIVRAKRVVLAAGSLGSTEILLRSETRSLKFSERLGEGFSINGGKILAGIGHPEPVHAVGHQESDPADGDARRIGPTITGLVRVPEAEEAGSKKPGFVIEEFAVPAGLRHVYGEVVALLATLSARSMGGTDPLVVADRDIDRIGLYGLTGDDGADGRLQLSGDTSVGGAGEGVRIERPTAKLSPLYERMQQWLGKKLKDASAFLVPDLLENIGEMLPTATVHPLGGCRMADDVSIGVVDHCGRVFRDGGAARDDLIVLDGAIVPRALGINPALTIAALAERAMVLLLAQWGWVPNDACFELSERPSARRRELPAADVVWSIRERVQGRFSIDQKTFWARMDIEFEEIPGFRRALALQSRVVAVRRAVLELYPAKEADDEFTVDEPEGDPICRAELGGSVALFEPIPGAPEDDSCVTLNYRLSVQSVQGDADAPLAIGGRLDGVKLLDPGSSVSPWRQLTEMDMRYDGAPVCRWALDLEDLAQRRDPLLRIKRLSSMPDALDDLAALALYVLRRTSFQLLMSIRKALRLPKAEHHLARRWPGRVDGVEPEIRRLCSGARVARYARAGNGNSAPGLPPVLLIHGLGTSGASFTDESLPDGLAATLLKASREVWVLDVRSSVGNEYARHGLEYQEALRWTVDGIARADLPAAVDVVHEAAGGRPIDVVAHCMGAVMFCLAALGGDEMKGKLRAVVLSQVGPLIRFSPFNRLRGYIASYLQQFLRVETFDTYPYYASRIADDGSVEWDEADSGIAPLLVDGLLYLFPYPDGDDEAGREENDEGLKESDFRRIRHRGDAIFGQMFELENVSDNVLKRLELFMGWVMVPMLSQAIHFARRNMLTNARGGNAVMHAANFKERFSFPLLIIHGRRNRVFNWRGSHDSWRMLKKLRDKEKEIKPPEPLKDGQGVMYGADTPTQLAVFDRYGHFDCMIGEHANRDIFGVISEFFGNAHNHRKVEAKEPPPQFEGPWIGPMIGWVQPVVDKRGRKWWKVRLMLHAQLRRTKVEDVVIVPVHNVAGSPVPQAGAARLVPWPAGAGRIATLDLHFSDAYLSKDQSDDMADGQSEGTSTDASRGTNTFVIVTMHRDLPLKPLVKLRRKRGPRWLMEGRAIAEEQQALESWIADRLHAEALANSVFSLAPKVLRGADRNKPDAAAKEIAFALASCQYPAGLFDVAPAAAAYERLLTDAMRPDGPQFLVLCGDQVYVDAAAGLFDPAVAAPEGGDVQDSGLDRIYEPNWRMRAFRRTTARLPTLTMLDDHEVRDNWKGLRSETNPAPEPVQRALDAYHRHQSCLNPDSPLVPDPKSGLGFCCYPGGMPFIVLDTRSERSPRTALNVERACIIPDDVMKRLCELIREAPPKSVKFIVSPSPILPTERFDPAHPAERLRSDSWSGYPASTISLLGFIRDENVRRVVFLSGDAHLSCACSFKFEGRDNQVISVVSSGMYAPWPFANQRPDELALSGRVDLGLPGSPFEGDMRLHAISLGNGYAQVRVAERGTDTWLMVSLRAANGATTDCSIRLQ
jgi:choline dehydrogenase-like flavoprotein/pimeloyl-ACP methyl ester carboxylesterase